MGCNNLIVGSNELHSVEISYVNDVNDIETFVKPIPLTNIITNKIILTQYSINKGLKAFGKKRESEVQK